MAFTEEQETCPGFDVRVFEVDAADGATTVELAGELDLSTAPQVREILAQPDVAGAQALRVDLTGVSFLDSTTIGLLVAAAKRIRASGGVFRVVCTRRSSVWRLFEVSGLVEYLHVEPIGSS
jgi:anti-sigma B factor antagonist